jgi:nucleoside-diphosphate-sugar epimerase
VDHKVGLVQAMRLPFVLQLCQHLVMRWSGATRAAASVVVTAATYNSTHYQWLWVMPFLLVALQGVVNVAAAAKTAGLQRVVLVSSAMVTPKVMHQTLPLTVVKGRLPWTPSRHTCSSHLRCQLKVLDMATTLHGCRTAGIPFACC